MLKTFFQRTMVISPHADDEMLGCGGLMGRVLAEVPSSYVRVIVLGTATVTNYETGYQVTTLEREQELEKAISILSKECRCGSAIDYSVLYTGMELRLDRIGMHKIVSDLDSAISAFRPTAVLVCYESHHQDHQIAARAATAAMRPSPSNRIRFRGLYEYAYSEAWYAGNYIRIPKFYVDISDYLEVKLNAFKAYESQQRPHEADLRSLESIRAFAKTRGIEAGVPYAEAFFPLSVCV
jgi:N-acetylglucosamine malate deacetylase 1